MARYLSIDWDHDRFFLVSVTTGRGKARIDKARLWEEPHTLQPGALEEAGKKFKDKLRAARINPAPVLACLGRDRVIFKEIRFPAVGASEEAALVRFQATKELTEPADRVVIDYTHLPKNSGNGERRAIVSIARKEWLRAIETFCKAAGLKLVAVTPRPFGIASCLQKLDAASGLSAPAPQPGAAVAVVVMSSAWAEFSIVRDGAVLFARSLPTGEGLLVDVRRNLALFSGQAQIGAGTSETVQALYFAGDEQHSVMRERLVDMLAIPVHPFDPFSSEQNIDVEGERGGFAGVAGLARCWAEQEKAPINFVRPKQPTVEKGSSKHLHYVATAAVAAVLLVGAFFAGNWFLANKQAEVNDKMRFVQMMERQIKKIEPETKKVDQLREWNQSAIPWVNELQDLTQRFPDAVDFKVNRVVIQPLTKKNPDDKFTMRMQITGVVPVKEKVLVQDFLQIINQDKYCKAIAGPEKQFKGEGSKRALQEFTILVDFAKEPLAERAAQLAVVNPYLNQTDSRNRRGGLQGRTRRGGQQRGATNRGGQRGATNRGGQRGIPNRGGQPGIPNRGGRGGTPTPPDPNPPDGGENQDKPPENPPNNDDE